MDMQDMEHRLGDLAPGDHLCCIYDTEEDHRAVLAPFLMQGLERREKVLYIVDAHTADTVLGYLQDLGLSVDPFLASGQLAVLTRQDAYLRSGHFDPERMIELLRAATDRALSEGWTALRATGEMTWALRGEPGSERLIEYESKLNDFFPGSKCLAVCQYDRRRFPPEILLDVLHTHPVVLIGTELYENFYYLPPAAFLRDRPASRLDQWLTALADHAKDERRRAFNLDVLACLSSGELSHNAIAGLLVVIERHAGVRASAVRLREGEDFPYVLARGFSREFVEADRSLWARDESGTPLCDENGRPLLECTCGAVIRGSLDSSLSAVTPGGAFWTNSTSELLASRTEGGRQGRICDRCRAEGHESVALVPLQADGEVVGLLQLGDRRRGRFEEESVQFLEGLCSSIGIALARRLEADRIRALDRFYRTVSEVNQLIVRERDRERLLTEVCRIAVDVGGFPATWIGLANRDTGVIHPVASAGLAPDLVAEVDLRLDGSPDALRPAGRAVFENRAVVVDDIETNPDFVTSRWTARRSGFRSCAAFPVRVESEARGALAVYGREPGAFPDEVVVLLTDLAADLGLALQGLEAEERRRLAEEALRDSEEKLSTLFEAIPVPVFFKDTGGRYLGCNRAFEALLGTSRGDLVGKTVHDLAPKEIADEYYRRDRELFERPGTQSYEWKVRAGTGEIREVVFSKATFADSQGRVAGLTGAVLDITERKRAEAALRESEARFSAAFHASPDLMAVTRLGDGTILQVNEAYSRLLGHSRADSIGRTTSELSIWADPADRVTFVTALQEHGQIKDFETKLRRKAGTAVECVDSARTFSFGGETCVVSVVHDITERKRAEAALQLSERRFGDFVEHALVGAYRTTEDGRVLMANSALARLLGFSSVEQLLQTNLDEWAKRHRYPRSVFKDALARAGVVAGFESACTRDDGAVVFMRESARAVRDETGATQYFEGIVEDVTEKRALTEQLLQAQKMEAVGRLAGGIAHDFNNLLQAMLSHAQILRTFPHRVEEELTELEAQVHRGAALSRQLLLFSRREPARRERLDLNQAIPTTGRLLRRLLREDVELVVETDGTSLFVDADRGQLDQVLMNLAVNAADAMPSGGRLTIRTGQDSERTWFSAEDTGCGIPEAIRDRVFDPFFTTKPVGQGTGLGLAVVHGIVAQHGGGIELESTTGVGTTVRVLLPGAGPEERPLQAPARATRTLPTGHGERVLLVEDEPGARAGLKAVLSSLGYAVTAAGSGEEATALPTEAPFSVLLSDVMLSGVAGPDLARTLLERWPRMRVILMSGYSEGDALSRAADLGEVRFLQKPFDMDALAQALRDALGGDPDARREPS